VAFFLSLSILNLELGTLNFAFLKSQAFFSGALAMITPNTWNPTDRDRMIYRWVKFDGHKQSWVADQLDMNQSTVSRIIDRYERWIAHGGPAQQGALSHDERRRAQRWLTFERNEWLLASAMRLAGEMEHLSDASKSTTTHHCSDPSREIEVRTENSIRDRTGTVCRYLRLAFRINMEQQKLADQDDLSALEPFTLNANEYSVALADSRAGFQSNNSPFVEADTLTRSVSEGPPEFGTALPTPPPPRPQVSYPAATAPDKSPISNFISQISDPPSAPVPCPPFPAPMHTVHELASHASPLTPTTPILSLEISPDKKQITPAYALPQNPPEPTELLNPIPDASMHQPLSPHTSLPCLEAASAS
jgi:hypothetical protein